jgi:hypothetical protein
MVWLNRIVLALPCVVLSLAGCSGGFPISKPASPYVSVIPSPITVAAGSITAFVAVFEPVPKGPGALTWSVTPASGGTVTNGGVYTASGITGNYAVVATWTPAILSPGGILSGSAAVEVIPVAQADAALNPDFVQASGALQVNGAVQNGVIAGQLQPYVISTDPAGDVQNTTGFTPPVVCPGSATTC